MAKSKRKPREVSPDEAALMFGRFIRTQERNALLQAMFPEGIHPLDREKVVARIRKHFPEVPRADIYRMNPGDLLYYLKETWRAEQEAMHESPATKPLTENHQKAFDLICTEGPLSGKAICNRLAIESESNFTGHYVPELKRHGVKSRRGLGYYHPDFYKPGPTLGGKT